MGHQPPNPPGPQPPPHQGYPPEQGPPQPGYPPMHGQPQQGYPPAPYQPHQAVHSQPGFPQPPQPYSGRPRPSAATAIAAAVVGFVAVAGTLAPIIVLTGPLVGSCGSSCFSGVTALELIALPVADLLLIVGGVALIARKSVGPILAAVGALAIFALLMAGAITPIRHGGFGILVGLGPLFPALAALILAVLPPTWRSTRTAH